MSGKISVPQNAMVLAGGLGTRMRPITSDMPKPLVSVAGKPLIDWGLDVLQAAGIKRAVVNVHYLADQLEAHLADRTTPQIIISDERDELLDSAGGIIKALPDLGKEAFYILNADTFWVEPQQSYSQPSNLERLAAQWNEAEMDILLLLATKTQATGYEGRGDFTIDVQQRLARLEPQQMSELIYAGAAIVHPRIFNGAEAGVVSLNRYFDQALAQGRLYGMPMQGHWLTVGTPDAIGEAELALEQYLDKVASLDAV